MIRAVESPLPVISLEDDEEENAAANMAPLCPGIDEEHLVTARTRNTAWGV